LEYSIIQSVLIELSNNVNIYNTLIESGGGTWPVEARQPSRRFLEKVLIPAGRFLPER
jgi:hypothetical protein